MRHWTREQLDEHYESLRRESHAAAARRAETPAQWAEKLRTLAGIELRFADVVDAAAERRSATFLEFQSLRHAARWRREEAAEYRSRAQEHETDAREDGA